MTYKEYIALVKECKNYNSAEIFLGEYGYPPNCEWSAEELTQVMNIIYAVSRNDVCALFEHQNLSAMCRDFGIPYRSVQNWVGGQRKAPDYVTQMIGFVLISELPQAKL